MDPLDDSGETRRRLRAARALAAPTPEERDARGRRKGRGGDEPGISQDELAARLEPEGRGYGRDTISLWERGERSPSTTQLRAIAHACGLPFEFFSVDLARLPEIAGELVEIYGVMPGEGGALREISARLAAIEDELGLRDAARSDHQALVRALDAADAAESPAASDIRGEAGANPEARPAHARGRQSS